MAAPEVRAQGAGEIKQPLSTTPPPGPSLFSALQKLLTPPLTLSRVCSLPEGGDPCGRRWGPGGDGSPVLGPLVLRFRSRLGLSLPAAQRGLHRQGLMTGEGLGRETGHTLSLGRALQVGPGL